MLRIAGPFLKALHEGLHVLSDLPQVGERPRVLDPGGAVVRDVALGTRAMLALPELAPHLAGVLLLDALRRRQVTFDRHRRWILHPSTEFLQGGRTQGGMRIEEGGQRVLRVRIMEDEKVT